MGVLQDVFPVEPLGFYCFMWSALFYILFLAEFILGFGNHIVNLSGKRLAFFL